MTITTGPLGLHLQEPDRYLMQCAQDNLDNLRAQINGDVPDDNYYRRLARKLDN